jgi:ABC-type transport system involved in cytochrome c biogenesis permease subunit
LLVAAIVWRCVLRGRPPVTTLYETKLFVTAVGVVVALVIEALGRQRLALSAAATLGALGVFVASGYEVLDKRDTMPALVAVLDTNFWLATHVTAISIGYAAGMLAALLASGYLLAKLFRVRRGDRPFYAALSRMVYGVLCFGLIFSLVGTMLGGIWANESWGRFWGWDPKENGALLIVISQLVILHARRGGYLREHGVCMAAAFGGTVVAFSWWGVNLLGVGLHSYGFTSGINTALWSYYGVQWSICGLGALAWLLERRAATPTPVEASSEDSRATRRAA